MRERVDRFTLLELLVVMAIIGILFSILLPSLSRARGEAFKKVCLSNLKQIGILNALYVSDSDGRLPGTMWGFWTRPKVQDYHLTGYYAVYLDLELNEKFDLLSCPSFKMTSSGSTDSLNAAMFNVWGIDPETGKRVYGNPYRPYPPFMISEIIDPVKVKQVQEHFDGPGPAYGFGPEPAEPLHGYKARNALRNVLRFDSSAVAEIDTDSIN